MKNKEELIEYLGLQKHPEGGYFKETYRSAMEFNIPEIGVRNISTGIYFLLDKANFSAFHRIKSDEMWHFYNGDSLLIHQIDQFGNYSNQVIGTDLANGELLQYVVPANVWFASEVLEGGEYSLVGCTVSFGFDFRDFELADSKFLNNFPQHEKIIKRLTR